MGIFRESERSDKEVYGYLLLLSIEHLNGSGIEKKDCNVAFQRKRKNKTNALNRSESRTLKSRRFRVFRAFAEHKRMIATLQKYAPRKEDELANVRFLRLKQMLQDISCCPMEYKDKWVDGWRTNVRTNGVQMYCKLTEERMVAIWQAK